MSERRLRLRAALAEYRWLVAVAAVVLLLAGAWVTYGAHVDPDVRDERRLDGRWTATGEFSHEATVRNENDLYPVDTRLDDEPLYFAEIAPVAEGTFVVSHDGAASEAVSIGLDAELVYGAVEEDTTYWERSMPLASSEATDVEPGEEVAVEFSVDVRELEDRIERIEDDLGVAPGQTEAAVAIDVSVDGTIAGEQRSLTRTHSVDLLLEGATYRFDAGGGFDESVEEYETEPVETSPGPARAVGGPLAALAGVGLAGVVVAFRAWGLEPTDAERRWLDFRDDLAEFEPLITSVRLPDAIRDRPEATAPTLGELCRFAVDAELPVVRDDGRYAVVGRELLYVYEPPPDPTTDGPGSALEFGDDLDEGPSNVAEPPRDAPGDGRDDAGITFDGADEPTAEGIDEGDR